MPKIRKSNKEAKKRPLLTKKEKKAAKKSRQDEKVLPGGANALRIHAPNSGNTHP